MILVVGLGNPGADYRATRHNFGFMALDALAHRLESQWTAEKKYNAETAEISLGNARKALLVKPQTFMNRSGEAVARIAQFYKIAPENIWVMYDDLDLPLGSIRVRQGGASGGHHGIESLEKSLGTSAFARIRLGIRGAELRQEHTERNIDTTAFVMDRFHVSEQPLVEKVCQTTSLLLAESLEKGSLRAHGYTIRSNT